MPSRILREGINSSSRVNALSMGAENLYRRLMSVADDHGRFYASVLTITAACWPTCPDKYSVAQVSEWLAECCAGERPLITIYEAEGAKFLQFDNFGQQIRSKSRFPECLAIAKQVISSTQSDQADPVNPSRSRSRSRISESDANTETSDALREPVPIRASGFPVAEWAERLYSQHPKKRGRPLVDSACLEILRKCVDQGVPPLPLFEKIAKIHALWAKSDDWLKENARYCPQLALWLDDEGWTVGAPARASPIPKEQIWSDLPSWKGHTVTPE